MKLSLRQMRGMRGLTQQEVADYTGIDAMTISRLERGTNSRFRTVAALCKFYNTSLDDVDIDNSYPVNLDDHSPP